jgi:exopolysaccharide biosynthesis polyprenyl glycosylphosphotransferase
MATATPNVPTSSRVRSNLAPTPHWGWETLTWTENVRSGEKLRAMFCDIAVVLANGTGLFLLFGANIGGWSQGSNSGSGLAPSGLQQHLEWLLAYAGLTVLACASMKVYDRKTALHGFSLFEIGKPVALSTIVFSVFLLSVNVYPGYWLLVVVMAACDLIGMSSWRILHWKVAASRSIHEQGSRRALIIGAGDTGRRLASYLEEDIGLGYTVTGFLDEDITVHPNVLGSLSHFPTILRSEFIDDVFITGYCDSVVIEHLSEEARQCGVDVKVVPEVCQHAISWQRVGDVPVMVIRSEPIPKVGLFLKRMLDIGGAVIGLAVLLPLLIAIAVLIRLDSPGPALYRSRRVGKKGARFKCFKFRTMSANADAIKDQLRSQNQRVGATFKISDDPRITRAGKWLRKYSLDELPQLWNVLRGDMSLVGPRPHPVDDYAQYGLEHRLRLKVTPGLTGLWQITARLEPSFERNIELDLEYIRNWSFWMDIKILVGTVPAVLRGEGQ